MEGCIDATAVYQCREAGVIAGQHGDLAAFDIHLAQLEQGDEFVVLQVAQGMFSCGCGELSGLGCSVRQTVCDQV